MIFVSHDRTFLRGLANRVLELGGECGTETEPHLYPGTYVEYVARTGPRGAGRARLALRAPREVLRGGRPGRPSAPRSPCGTRPYPPGSHARTARPDLTPGTCPDPAGRYDPGCD